jgi:hypothetical protein
VATMSGLLSYVMRASRPPAVASAECFEVVLACVASGCFDVGARVWPGLSRASSVDLGARAYVLASDRQASYKDRHTDRPVLSRAYQFGREAHPGMMLREAKVAR